MRKDQKKKIIIYLVGESAQGKTTLAKKLEVILGACVLMSDEANRLSAPTYEKEKKMEIYTRMYRGSDIIIAEGMALGAPGEREICREALELKECVEYMLKLDVPGLKERQIKKWRGKEEEKLIPGMGKTFTDSFEPLDKTYIIDDYDYCMDMFQEHGLSAFNFFKEYK